MSKISIAVQKSGRLSSESLALLKECGLKVSSEPNALKMIIPNFPAEVLFLRDDDIPGYVADGVVDIGIVGQNVFSESKADVDLIDQLGFAHCRLVIAVPRSSKITTVKDLSGKRIATSYPRLLRDFLANQGVSASIHEISGSVEIAPSIGLADAVCDLVSSGSTLIKNDLVELMTVLQSEAVLIANRNLSVDKRAVVEKLLFRIRAVKDGSSAKYIMMNVPNKAIDKICEVIPGMRSPGVLPLRESGWSSLHTVVNEAILWEKIEVLRELGAEGILVVPIEKMFL